MGQALPEPDAGEESEIEIRQVFEAEDFGAEFTPELRKQEERLRARSPKEVATDTKETRRCSHDAVQAGPGVGAPAERRRRWRTWAS